MTTRKTSHYLPDMAYTMLIVLLSLFGLVGCANGLFTSTNHSAEIDYVNFVRFNGITYLAAARPGRALVESDLGPVFATTTFQLDGNVQDPNYQNKDGDAAFLAAGTKVYTVKGYRSTFRLAAHQNNGLTLYEADSNPHAKSGADLLDLDGKVRYIGIGSGQDGVTELATIKSAKQVNQLVSQVLQAPVNQNAQAGSKQYFIVFHMQDGTVVSRSYWLDTGELARGILLPRSFGQAIAAALH